MSLLNSPFRACLVLAAIASVHGVSAASAATRSVAPVSAQAVVDQPLREQRPAEDLASYAHSDASGAARVHAAEPLALVERERLGSGPAPSPKAPCCIEF